MITMDMMWIIRVIRAGWNYWGMNIPSPILLKIQRPPLAGGLGPTAEANRGGINTNLTLHMLSVSSISRKNDALHTPSKHTCLKL